MILRSGFITALFIFQVRCLKPEGCDPSLHAWFREGILGQVGMFPWLGVIRVQLYEGVKVRTALTGAILIKDNYALTIADDIARIPQKIFRRDSKALFIPTDGEPWLCRLKNYTTHPEYSTIKNTIALIELELEVNSLVPLVPICWSTYPYLYNTSNQLYVLGITDANDILEKEVYKVQYVQQSDCIQWYDREGLHSERDYQCVSLESGKRQCVYETGMVLASNATGTWSLLGFGIHGPGCSSPARFIEMYKYLPWIESTTSDVQIGGSFEKQALRKDFGSHKNIPVHQLFRSEKQTDADLSNRVVPWDFDRYESGLVPEVVRIDQNAITLFDSKYELNKGDCFQTSKLIYSDSVKIHSEKPGGKAYYQLSLMDLTVMNYTCVLVRVDAKQKSKTRLWYNFGNFIDPLDGADETPKELVKKYPVPKRENHSNDSTETTTAKPKTLRKRLINNNKRYTKLVSDKVVNELLAIKNELETTRKVLNITGKADIDKTFRKMFAVKGKLQDVRDKLGSPVPDSLKDSISILDKAASELRAGKTFYQGKLMDVRQREVQKSIDLIKEFQEQPETFEIETLTDNTEINVKEAIKRVKAKGTQEEKPTWKPHKYLEVEYITDRPGWWLYYPHLNLELEFYFHSEAELKIEVWSNSYIKKVPTTQKPKAKPIRTRKPPDNPAETDSNNVQTIPDGNNLPPEFVPTNIPPVFDPNILPPELDPPNNLPPGVDANNFLSGLNLTNVPPGFDEANIPSGMFPKNPRSAGDRFLRDKIQLTEIRGIDSVNTTTNRPNTNPRSSNILNNHPVANPPPAISPNYHPAANHPPSGISPNYYPPVNHPLAGQRFLRNNTKLRTYSELKRAEYDDLRYTKIRGTESFDEEKTDGSDNVRSERLCVVVVVFCIFFV